MEIKLGRGSETIEVSKVRVIIEDTKYDITETVDGKLNINKVYEDDSVLSVFPRYSNEIEVK
jgi:hypothetical protein